MLVSGINQSAIFVVEYFLEIIPLLCHSIVLLVVLILVSLYSYV